MNAEYKTKWLEALRSKKYPQGRSLLRTEVGYCCLGVLCDIVEPDGWEENPVCYNHLGLMTLPKSSVYDTTGLDKDVNNTHGLLIGHAVKMNDNGKSFDEIADWIEKNIPGV